MNDVGALHVCEWQGPPGRDRPGDHSIPGSSREGNLILPKCTSCGRLHWYPRAHCPFCWSSAIAWQPISGLGKVYSFSAMRRATDPYTIAYVMLDEGPTMMTSIVDCDFDVIRIDQRVKVVFKQPASGPPYAAFTPA